MSEPFDVSVLPPFTPNMVIVIRGGDFGHDEDAKRAIWDHYIAAAKASGIAPGTPAEDVLPLIIHLPFSDSSIEVLDEDEMAAAGWVRK